MKKSFDVRIASYFRKIIDKYLNYRQTPDDDAEQRWLNNFRDGRVSFVHQIGTIKLNLYRNSILCKFIYDSFEESEILFTRKFLKSGDCFVDAGANIGLFSLNAASCVGSLGHVYAFEPAPVTFVRLQENVKLNQFDNITLVNAGLSDKNERLQLQVSLSGFDAWNSFASLDCLGDKTTVNVPVVTIYDYMLNQGILNVTLLKIDVEGWEMYVLKGATELMKSENAPVLMVEFTEENAFAAGFYCGEIFDFVRSFGYEWYSYNALTNSLELQRKKLHYPYENLIAIIELKSVLNRINQ